MIRSLHAAGILAVVASLAIAVPAEGQHAGKGKDKLDTDAPAASGQVVAVDAQSGKLRAPTREEVRALVDAAARSLSQSTEGLREETAPSGAVFVTLDGRFESVSLARIDGGKAITRCVETPDEARAFLETSPNAPAPRAPALEEK